MQLRRQDGGQHKHSEVQSHRAFKAWRAAHHKEGGPRAQGHAAAQVTLRRRYTQTSRAEVISNAEVPNATRHWPTVNTQEHLCTAEPAHKLTEPGCWVLCMGNGQAQMGETSVAAAVILCERDSY